MTPNTAQSAKTLDNFLDNLSLPAVLKWFIAGCAGIWVHDVPATMKTLMMFMCVDYATGLLAAWYQRKLSSRTGLRGLVTKGCILALLLLSHHIEAVIHLELNLETVGAVGYSVNEIISILENFSRAGVPLPSALVQALLAAKNLRPKIATQDELKALDAD